jgi:tripartite motif-containing protein 71
MLNSRIQKFSQNGTFIMKWGVNGSGNGEFNWPSGIAEDSDGYIYVVERTNMRVQKYERQ